MVNFCGGVLTGGGRQVGKGIKARGDEHNENELTKA